MARRLSLFDGCYEAARVAALSGVPQSTVYDWARKQVVTPSISAERTMLWSYADLMVLRIVYWLRHPKPGEEATIPASPMGQIRDALAHLDEYGIDPWAGESGDSSPLRVDRSGRVFLDLEDRLEAASRQTAYAPALDLLGPFDAPGASGPDLRRPRPHLRIVPGKLGGEPHLAHSRLTTLAVAALSARGYSVDAIHALYPAEPTEAIGEAIDLEQRLAA
jgi:uncharacterized protein (DUF433 family)